MSEEKKEMDLGGLAHKLDVSKDEFSKTVDNDKDLIKQFIKYPSEIYEWLIEKEDCLMDEEKAAEAHTYLKTAMEMICNSDYVISLYKLTKDKKDVEGTNIIKQSLVDMLTTYSNRRVLNKVLPAMDISDLKDMDIGNKLLEIKHYELALSAFNMIKDTEGAEKVKEKIAQEWDIDKAYSTLKGDTKYIKVLKERILEQNPGLKEQETRVDKLLGL